MPIRPENKDRYPDDWDAISIRIRFDRAKGFCECEGECGKHGDRCWELHRSQGTPGVIDGIVIITTAHLDHTPENCADDNLKAFCQRCHNAYDAPHRQHMKRERLALEAGQTNIFT